MKPENLDIKIKLPSEITVHMPSFGEIGIESVYKAIATTGVDFVKRTIYDRLMDAFVAEQEPFIKQKVSELLEEKRDEIKRLLSPL